MSTYMIYQSLPQANSILQHSSSHHEGRSRFDGSNFFMDNQVPSSALADYYQYYYSEDDLLPLERDDYDASTWLSSTSTAASSSLPSFRAAPIKFTRDDSDEGGRPYLDVAGPPTNTTSRKRSTSSSLKSPPPRTVTTRASSFVEDEEDENKDGRKQTNNVFIVVEEAPNGNKKPRISSLTWSSSLDPEWFRSIVEHEEEEKADSPKTTLTNSLPEMIVRPVTPENTPKQTNVSLHPHHRRMLSMSTSDFDSFALPSLVDGWE